MNPVEYSKNMPKQRKKNEEEDNYKEKKSRENIKRKECKVCVWNHMPPTRLPFPSL